MTVDSHLPSAVARWWRREPPTSPEALSALAAGASAPLPTDYLALLALTNGGEGELGIEPGWFWLWKAEEVLETHRGYDMSEFLPGLFAFGTSGGGEFLAFDTRTAPPWKIVMVPSCPMDVREAVVIADDFAEFVRATGREHQSGV